MTNKIIHELEKIEESENVTIIHAVESGSRAWGFASPDSDYDVRFLYVRNRDFYLRLDKARDVIEIPIDDELDINGWDLDKSFKLLHSSNPTFFEWCNSPIVYKTTPYFNAINSVKHEYFKIKSAVCHYLSMAKGNYKTFLQGEYIKPKKYFYVVRSILACKWILENKNSPPMLFSELCDSQLIKELKEPIESLLDIKINTPEISSIPRVEIIHTYIDKELEYLQEIVNTLPKDITKGYDDLNKLFLQAFI